MMTPERLNWHRERLAASIPYLANEVQEFVDEIDRLRLIVGKLAGSMNVGEYVILSLKHGYVGNCYQFWGPDQCGYVCGLARAGRYSLAEAREILTRSEMSIMVPVRLAVEHAEATVDMQTGLVSLAAKDAACDGLAELEKESH